MRRVVVVAVVLAVLIAVFALTRTHSSSSKQTAPSGRGSTWKRPTGVTVDARKVAGTVYLEDAVAGGATVRLTKGLIERTTQTDARGHFEFAAVASDRYTVIAEVAHATGAMLALDLANPVVDPEALRLVAHACTASLHGVVRDVSGGVIAKARVAVASWQSAGPGVEAADDGSYELCVPVGDGNVIVRADGYADAFASINIYGRVTRDFALMPEAVVAGRTVHDGAPVEGAEVTLTIEDFRMARGLPYVSAVSDADGRFRFHGIAAGAYTVSATADHLATRDPVEVTAEVATPVEDLEVPLDAALSISGHTVDKQKKPVAHAVVVLRTTDDGISYGRRFRNTRSRDDGSFVFENLTPAEYRIGTFSEGPESTGTELELDKSDITGVTIEVDTLGSISGRVTRAGKPVEGANVQAQTQVEDESFVPPTNTVTDADGRFEIDGIRAGAYHLYAESKRLGAFTQGPKVNVREGEAVKGVEVELELAGSIAGTVVDQNGAAVAGVHVRFSLGNRDFGEATTADNGTFKAGALSGGGDYDYEVRPAADSPVSFKPAAGTKFTPVSVKDGNTDVTGVLIKIQYERLSISGRVVTADGAPVPDVAVSAERRMTRFWSTPVATTDEHGGFVIKDLTAGKYVVSARSPKGSRELTNIAAGATNVELRLPVLGEIKGTLDGFPHSPAITALPTDTGMMMQEARGIVTGTTFVIKNVPVGSYVVRATAVDGYAQGKVTVDAKQPATITLKNPGVGTVEGTVIDESTRQPIEELYCRSSGNGSGRSDKAGRFRLTRVPAGPSDVHCLGETYDATAKITVEVGKTTHVDLVAKKREPPKSGESGLVLEVKTDELVVKSVTGPAERAGIKVGDTITKVRGYDVGAMFGADNVKSMIDAEPAGSIVKITLERDDKERTVEVTLE